MIRALLSGVLHTDPQARASQSGKPFTTGKLKADAADGGTVWCSLIAFGDVGERLATLKAGAALSVSGRAKLTAWTGKDGNLAAGLDLTIEELTTLRGKPKAQGQEATQPAQASARPYAQRRPARQPPPVSHGTPFDDMDYFQV